MNLNKNNLIIGIDTSCYTTSIAAITLDKQVILNEKIMLKVKENSRGLRQSEGVFQHVNNLGVLSEKIDKLKEKYEIVAICASEKPRPITESYMPVFNVGYNFSKLFSGLGGCKFYKTTHQENHIEASLLTNTLDNQNCFLSIHMSGGTTEILLVENKDSDYSVTIVGGSRDLSFGQLIDRIGVNLGYEFPAGKYVDEMACKCNETIRKGLKTSVKEGYMNLSGLENQINKVIDQEDEKYICKLMLDSVVRNILKSLLYICEKYNIKEVVFAGGVSASKYISRELDIKLKRNDIKAYFTKPEYCTDSGVGCALIGVKKYEIESIRN